jgi:hypothetical protein
MPLADLTPARLWQRLDLDTRVLAARAFYEEPGEDRSLHKGVDAAIARTLRFREASVRKLPIDKKAGYLARVVHPDDLLASALLQAFHLAHRRALLGAFLDALAIPHRDGTIDPEAKLEPQPAAALAPAVDKLAAAFPAAEVDLYLASLLAVDRENWLALHEVIAARG